MCMFDHENLYCKESMPTEEEFGNDEEETFEVSSNELDHNDYYQDDLLTTDENNMLQYLSCLMSWNDYKFKYLNQDPEEFLYFSNCHYDAIVNYYNVIENGIEKSKWSCNKTSCIFGMTDWYGNNLITRYEIPNCFRMQGFNYQASKIFNEHTRYFCDWCNLFIYGSEVKEFCPECDI